MKGPRV